MAPVRPKTKAGKAVKSPDKPESSSSFQQNNNNDNGDDTLRSSKRDKRQIKHAALLSKIEKPRQKKPLKRRRPSKKLVASLDSLADALPNAGGEDDNNDDTATGGQSAGGADAAASQANVIRQRSLKHRPGALKRKAKLDRLERDRFAKNMAQMADGINGGGSDRKRAATTGSTASTSADGGGGGVGADNPGTSARWAALRSFISQTMDQNPDRRPSKPS